MYLIIKPKSGPAEMIHTSTTPGILAETVIKSVIGRDISWVQILDSNGRNMGTVDNPYPVTSPIRPAKSIPAVESEVRGMLTKGTSKIQAIKRYREVTGLTLKESKDAVDKICIGIPGFCRICGSHAEYRSIAQQRSGRFAYDVCRNHCHISTLSKCAACGYELVLLGPGHNNRWVTTEDHHVCMFHGSDSTAHKISPVNRHEEYCNSCLRFKDDPSCNH